MAKAECDLVDVSDQLQAIIIAHKQGKPVIREMAARIAARAAERGTYSRNDEDPFA